MVKLRKHSVHTHFPNRPNCDVCLSTKITRNPCRRGTGEASIPRAEKFVDLITADHKILNEEGLRQRNDPKHVVMASELPSSGKPVRGRQDPERDEPDLQAHGQLVHFRNCGASLKINSGTRENGTRVHAYERNSLSSNIMVTRMVRHHDQDDEIMMEQYIATQYIQYYRKTLKMK